LSYINQAAGEFISAEGQKIMKKNTYSQKSEKGQVLVEFALVLILLLMICYGITEFGRAWYRADRLKNAANTAARTFAVTKQWPQSQFAAYSAMGTTSVTVTPTPNPADPNGASIKVTVSEQFQTLVPGILPMLNNIATLRRDATYRMEQ